MSYKTILAVLASPADVGPVIAAALRTPSGRNIHLMGTHGEPSQFVTMSAPVDIPDVTTLTTLYEEADRRMTAVGDAFREACRQEDICGDWRPLRTPAGDSGTSALASSRIADLVILRQAGPDEVEHPRIDSETLLFEGGSPVLILGPEGRLAEPVRRVLIAWDGSREAARAAKDALPFLEAAEEVEILIVDADRLSEIDRPSPGADLAASLDRHGVKVSIALEATAGRSVSEVIAGRAKAINADLLVMGAYAHPRLRDWLFGGVTQSIMAEVPVPTLLSR